MHVGPIAIQAQTTPDKALELYRAILAEVDKFDDPGYVTDQELDAAKSEVGVAQIYGREQASSFAHTVGFWWAVAASTTISGTSTECRPSRRTTSPVSPAPG